MHLSLQLLCKLSVAGSSFIHRTSPFQPQGWACGMLHFCGQFHYLKRGGRIVLLPLIISDNICFIKSVNMVWLIGIKIVDRLCVCVLPWKQLCWFVVTHAQYSIIHFRGLGSEIHNEYLLDSSFYETHLKGNHWRDVFPTSYYWRYLFPNSYQDPYTFLTGIAHPQLLSLRKQAIFPFFQQLCEIHI